MQEIIILLMLCCAAVVASETKTNLQATVSSQIVTNVVAGDNQRGCATCETLRVGALSGSMIALYHPWHNAEPWKAADEKWEITNVSSNLTVRIQWNGKMLVHTEETLLLSTTNRWKLAQEWKKE